MDLTGSKKKKASKDLKGTKKTPKVSGVQRPWHCQVRLITADMMGRLIFGRESEGARGSLAHQLRPQLQRWAE